MTCERGSPQICASRVGRCSDSSRPLLLQVGPVSEDGYGYARTRRTTIVGDFPELPGRRFELVELRARPAGCIDAAGNSGPPHPPRRHVQVQRSLLAHGDRVRTYEHENTGYVRDGTSRRESRHMNRPPARRKQRSSAPAAPPPQRGVQPLPAPACARPKGPHRRTRRRSQKSWRLQEKKQKAGWIMHRRVGSASDDGAGLWSRVALSENARRKMGWCHGVLGGEMTR